MTRRVYSEDSLLRLYRFFRNSPYRESTRGRAAQLAWRYWRKGSVV